MYKSLKWASLFDSWYFCCRSKILSICLNNSSRDCVDQNWQIWKWIAPPIYFFEFQFLSDQKHLCEHTRIVFKFKRGPWLKAFKLIKIRRLVNLTEWRWLKVMVEYDRIWPKPRISFWSYPTGKVCHCGIIYVGLRDDL